jgi:hypothetical protein
LGSDQWWPGSEARWLDAAKSKHGYFSFLDTNKQDPCSPQKNVPCCSTATQQTWHKQGTAPTGCSTLVAPCRVNPCTMFLVNEAHSGGKTTKHQLLSTQDLRLPRTSSGSIPWGKDIPKMHAIQGDCGEEDRQHSTAFGCFLRTSTLEHAQQTYCCRQSTVHTCRREF